MRRLLGVDLGEARIGLALSDELRLLAHPLETITNGSTVLPRIKQLIAEKNIECVVIGLPRHMNGALGASAHNAKRFAEKLRENTDRKCRVSGAAVTAVTSRSCLTPLSPKSIACQSPSVGP